MLRVVLFGNSTDGNAALKWEHFNKFDSDSPFKEVNKSNPVEWAKSVNEILLRFERSPGPSSESEGDRPGSVEPVAGIQKGKKLEKTKIRRSFQFKFIVDRTHSLWQKS